MKKLPAPKVDKGIKTSSLGEANQEFLSQWRKWTKTQMQKQRHHPEKGAPLRVVLRESKGHYENMKGPPITQDFPFGNTQFNFSVFWELQAKAIWKKPDNKAGLEKATL